MFKLTLQFIGGMILATVALLAYSVVTDDAPAMCREFSACGTSTKAP
jgi:hypothetical protein